MPAPVAAPLNTMYAPNMIIGSIPHAAAAASTSNVSHTAKHSGRTSEGFPAGMTETSIPFSALASPMIVGTTPGKMHVLCVLPYMSTVSIAVSASWMPTYARPKRRVWETLEQGQWRRGVHDDANGRTYGCAIHNLHPPSRIG